MNATHTPVLLHETIDGMALSGAETVVDGTINGGGHSEAIVGSLSASGTLVGIDRDETALAAAQARLESAACTVHLRQGNFRNIDQILREIGISRIDRLLLDLGLSSRQLGDSGRGFRFNATEPLQMTFEAAPGAGRLTAREIVNEWNTDKIATIIAGYGEERYATAIAHGIGAYRQTQPIETSKELAEIVVAAVPPRARRGRIHPATRTFQALRITVNDEIDALRDVLRKADHLTADGGRILVITFHSIEDRVVKQQFRQWEQDGRGHRITKKPIVPAEREIQHNPRARSAKLRIFAFG